jgi:hypothetical protein
MSEDCFLPRRTAQWNPTRGAWETGQQDLLSMRSELFLETWPVSGMTRGGVVFELPTPAHPTLVSVSSVLPTPRASDGEKGGPNQRGSKGDLTMSSVVQMLLPTPAAMNPNDGESLDTWEARRVRVKLTAKNGNGFGTPLAIAVQLLPTPVAQEGVKATARQGSEQKSQTGQVWLTNIAHDLAVLNGESTDPLSTVGSKPSDV